MQDVPFAHAKTEAVRLISQACAVCGLEYGIGHTRPEFSPRFDGEMMIMIPVAKDDISRSDLGRFLYRAVNDLLQTTVCIHGPELRFRGSLQTLERVWQEIVFMGLSARWVLRLDAALHGNRPGMSGTYDAPPETTPPPAPGSDRTETKPYPLP